ncbi:MAG TPA: carboxymuconolactone decarboxylase family protein [Gemmatimonadales bacterium]
MTQKSPPPASVAPSLDTRTIALVRVAMGVSRGDEHAIRERMRAARAAGVPVVWMEELLLQSFLNVGYPLALAAFAIWRELAGPEVDGGESLLHVEHGVWSERGQQRCAEVYGRTYHKLRLNLRDLHPAVESLVIVDAYGKILGRPGLDAARRELCTLAAITMLHAPRQLHAHLRGALNLGWSREDVDAVLVLAEQDLGAARALKVWELWADVRERGLDSSKKKADG